MYYVILALSFSAVASGTAVLVVFNTSKSVAAVSGEIIFLSVLPHQSYCRSLPSGFKELKEEIGRASCSPSAP